MIVYFAFLLLFNFIYVYGQGVPTVVITSPANDEVFYFSQQHSFQVYLLTDGLSAFTGTVTQTCTGMPAANYTVDTNIPVNIPLPEPVSAPIKCELFAIVDHVPSLPVQFTVKSGTPPTDVALTIYIPQNVMAFDASEEIDFGYTITTSKSLLTENDITPVRYAQLLCSGAPNRPQFFLAVAEIMNKFKIARHLYGNCEFSFPGLPDYVKLTSPVNIIVNQKMFFDLPVENGETEIPDDLAIKLMTGFVDLPTVVELQVKCPESGTEKKVFVTTTVLENINLDSSFYGLCEWSMPTQILPDFFLPPDPIQFNRMFYLDTGEGPKNIVINQPFTVEVVASGAPPIDDTANLGLFCSGNADVPSFIWTGIEFKTNTELILPDMHDISGPECTLQPYSTKSYYKSGPKIPVLLILQSTSPFGGNLYPISTKDVKNFLNEITAAPSSWFHLTILTNAN